MFAHIYITNFESTNPMEIKEGPYRTTMYEKNTILLSFYFYRGGLLSRVFYKLSVRRNMQDKTKYTLTVNDGRNTVENLTSDCE